MNTLIKCAGTGRKIWLVWKKLQTDSMPGWRAIRMSSSAAHGCCSPSGGRARDMGWESSVVKSWVPASLKMMQKRGTIFYLLKSGKRPSWPWKTSGKDNLLVPLASAVISSPVSPSASISLANWQRAEEPATLALPRKSFPSWWGNRFDPLLILNLKNHPGVAKPRFWEIELLLISMLNTK